MKTSYLTAFDAFMTHGTTLAAAQVTGMSQPVISRNLTELEAELGIELFKRTRNQISPLPEAWLFHSSVRDVLNGFLTLKQEAHAIRDAQSGTIVVAAQPVYCDSFLLDALSRFKQEHAEFSVRLVDAGLVEMQKMLDEGRCDLAFGITLGAGKSARPHTPLASCVAKCLLPKNHPFADVEEIPLPRLLQEPFVDLVPGSPLRTRIDTLLQSISVTRTIRAEMRHLRGVCSLVERGIGVAIVDPVAELIIDPRKLVLRDLLPTVHWQLAQFAPENRPLSRGAIAFGTFVEAEIQAMIERRVLQDVPMGKK